MITTVMPRTVLVAPRDVTGDEASELARPVVEARRAAFRSAAEQVSP